MPKDERPPLYDYVQQRIKEKVIEDKYLGLIVTEEESAELRAAIQKQKEKEIRAAEVA